MTAPREGHPFHVGQRVVCIEHAPDLGFPRGSLHTVSAIGTFEDFALKGHVVRVTGAPETMAIQTAGVAWPMPVGGTLYINCVQASGFRPLNEQEQSEAVQRTVGLFSHHLIDAPAPVEGEDA